jgi:hypothetical protein
LLFDGKEEERHCDSPFQGPWSPAPAGGVTTL